MHLWRRSHKTVVVHWTSDFFCNYCVCKRRQLLKSSSNDVYNNESRITVVEMSIWRYFLRTLSWSACHLRARESFPLISFTQSPSVLQLFVCVLVLPSSRCHRPLYVSSPSRCHVIELWQVFLCRHCFQPPSTSQVCMSVSFSEITLAASHVHRCEMLL